jgi:hypothetical protein
MAENTFIVIDRIHHYRDTIRPYKVVIDGEVAAKVMDSKRTEISVRPGIRTIQVKLMWISSRVMQVDVPAGQTTWLRTGPSGGILQAWRLFLTPRDNMFIEAITEAEAGEREEEEDED